MDEERLFNALEPLYSELTDAEIKRNIRGDDRLYLGPKHGQYSYLRTLYTTGLNMDQENAFSAEGMRGSIILSDVCVSEGG